MTAKCELHPLIHTLLKFSLAQDIANCQPGRKWGGRWERLQDCGWWAGNTDVTL